MCGWVGRSKTTRNKTSVSVVPFWQVLVGVSLNNLFLLLVWLIVVSQHSNAEWPSHSIKVDRLFVDRLLNVFESDWFIHGLLMGLSMMVISPLCYLIYHYYNNNNDNDDEKKSSIVVTKQDKNNPSNELKRSENEYLSWDDYFMSVAKLSSYRSKDPNTQVGACVVSEDLKIVGVGYNGMPLGCSDDELPWARTGPSRSATKYPWVCHAEMNAILNCSNMDIKGCTLFTVLFPCNECAKLIIQSRITRVIYESDKYRNLEDFRVSRRMLDMAGVEVTHYSPKKVRFVIDFRQPCLTGVVHRDEDCCYSHTPEGE